MDDTQRTGWQKRILLFLTSQCITLFGSTLVQMALVWYATMQTSSGVWVAAFTVCSYLPQFLISFIGGVWADRYHRKKLIIGADLLIAFVTFVMVLAIPHISSEPALLGGLLVMSVIRSLGAGIQTPAVNAVIPQLVPEDQLMRYNGINATMQSIVNFAAPAAAGAVFAISTLRMTLMIDIVTAILGTGLLSCLALPKQNTSIEKASVFSDMKIGVKYAFADKLIGKLLIIYGLFTFFCVPAGYLAGLLVRRVFGDTYWYLTAVEVVGFAGMMAGGVIMSTWGGFKHRGKTLAVGLFAFGSFAIGMGFSKNFIFYLGLMVCYGVALTMVQTAITTMLQEKTDTSMQGRVFGLLGTMYAGFLPIGMAMFGPLADILPLQWIMIGSGIALTLWYFKKKSPHVKIGRIRIDGELLPQVLSVGVSALLMQILTLVQQTVIYRVASNYGGETSQLLLGAALRFWNFSFVPLWGISQGFQPAAGTNYGAKDYDRVKTLTRVFITAATLLSLVFYIPAELFPEKILSMFLTTPGIAASGATNFRIMFSTYVLQGSFMIAVTLFQSLGKAKKATWLVLFRQIILFIPLCVVLPMIGGMGIRGVWLAIALTDAILVVITVSMMLYEFGKLPETSSVNR